MKYSFRIRFGLRTLMVIFTIACIGLGIWVRRANEQFKAVSQLEAGGARVLYDFEFSNHEFDSAAKPRLAGLFGSDWRFHLFNTAIGVNIGAMGHPDVSDRNGGDHTYDDNFRISDETYAALKQLRQMTFLSLNSANMSNDELKHVANLRSLQELGLERVPVDGEGLAHLASLPNLTGLSLWGCRLSDETLDGLLKIRTLKSVSVGETFVTTAGADRVQAALPNCKVYY